MPRRNILTANHLEQVQIRGGYPTDLDCGWCKTKIEDLDTAIQCQDCWLTFKPSITSCIGPNGIAVDNRRYNASIASILHMLIWQSSVLSASGASTPSASRYSIAARRARIPTTLLPKTGLAILLVGALTPNLLGQRVRLRRLSRRSSRFSSSCMLLKLNIEREVLPLQHSLRATQPTYRR